MENIEKKSEIIDADVLTSEEFNHLGGQINEYYKKKFKVDISAITDTIIDEVIKGAIKTAVRMAIETAIGVVIEAGTKKELASLESRIVD